MEINIKEMQKRVRLADEIMKRYSKIGARAFGEYGCKLNNGLEDYDVICVHNEETNFGFGFYFSTGKICYVCYSDESGDHSISGLDVEIARCHNPFLMTLKKGFYKVTTTIWKVKEYAKYGVQKIAMR